MQGSGLRAGGLGRTSTTFVVPSLESPVKAFREREMIKQGMH